MTTKKKYEGSIMGFNYKVEFFTDDEFETWLEEKLRQYLLPDNSIEKRVISKILGLDIIEEKVRILETEIQTKT